MNKLIFDIINTLIALIGVILVIIGLIIPYKQSLDLNKLQQENQISLEKKKWKKEFIDYQISCLYGPIYAIIVRNDVRFNRILDQLGRKAIIPSNKSFGELPKVEQELWKHYVDTYKISSQLEIAEIFKKNFHLIYNSEIPSCYKTFLDYSLGWEMLDNQKKNGVSNFYEYYYMYNYPKEFDQYIRETLEILMTEQQKLINDTID